MAEDTDLIDPNQATAIRIAADGLESMAGQLATTFGLDEDQGGLTILALAYVTALARHAGPSLSADQAARIVRVAQRMLAREFMEIHGGLFADQRELVN